MKNKGDYLAWTDLVTTIIGKTGAVKRVHRCPPAVGDRTADCMGFVWVGGGGEEEEGTMNE